MAEYERRVREIIGSFGCFFIRHGKGDHDIWFSPITNRNVTVPVKIKSRYTANAILKQCGTDKRL
ncbi:MAG: type II toxin-antitoxin system HicA family toxin [Firmicutes bacterium]|nr:type II toxin-antitoxin system HicA family toxin [Bacillota bacterium]